MALVSGIRRTQVPVPTDPGEPEVFIAVRGLAPSEIRAVMQEDGGEALAGVYASMVNEATNSADVADLILKFLAEIPELCAKLIARAADDRDNWQLALTMPTGLQIELIYAIGALTFESEAVAKKAREVLQKFAASGRMKDLLQRYENGFGASVSR